MGLPQDVLPFLLSYRYRYIDSTILKIGIKIQYILKVEQNLKEIYSNHNQHLMNLLSIGNNRLKVKSYLSH